MHEMRFVDVFVQDAIAWLIATPEADYLTEEEFSFAIRDRAAYLAHLSAE